jgi:competence protein ComEC
MRPSKKSFRSWGRTFAASGKNGAAGRDPEYLRPVIPLTLSLIAGIALGVMLPAFEAAALAAAAGFGAWSLGCLLRRRRAALSPLALFVCLGYLSLQPWINPRFPSDHVSRYLDTGPWEITGVVDARPMEFESRTRFILRVESLRDERAVLPVSGRLRVTLIGDGGSAAHGDRVTLRSRIRPVRNFNNPGGFDFKRHMQFEGVCATAFADNARMVKYDAPAGADLAGAVDAARTAIARLIDASAPFPESAVLKALVIGERAEIPDVIQEAFRRTGTTHILAISGLNFAIVASASFLLFRWLLGWIRPLLLNGWAGKGAALLTLAPVVLYALLAGMSPSTQRALIMAMAFLLAFLVEREQDLMNTLALAALVILVFHPPALFSVSFQLSFAAVFSIVYGFARLRPAPTAATPAPTAGRLDRARRSLTVFFLVSIFATWGTLPLILHYFNMVSLISLPANCLAIPLIGYAAVLSGLIGSFLAPLSPAIAMLCFKAGGFVLSLAMALMQQMAALPFAAVRTVTPSIFEVIWCYTASWLLIRLFAAWRAAPAGPPARPVAGRIRNAAARAGSRIAAARAAAPVCSAAGAMALCLLAGAVDAGYWSYQRFWRRDLRVTVLDVGQGSAVLLQLPDGGTALVDGGGFPYASAFDVGAAVVAPFLWRQKIAALDTLILTHANSDHVNGLNFIAENFDVGTIWTHGDGYESWGYRTLMQTCARRGIPAPAFSSLPRETEAKGVRLELLYPPPDFSERKRIDRFRRDENNNSLVVRAGFGDFSILIPGDIMHAAERELVSLAAEKLGSTVMVAPHHGSRTSSSELFLSSVAPRTVLISCGERAGSGPPHPDVLKRYQDHGARIYRTDRDGAILLVSDGRTYSIETRDPAPAGITRDIFF